MIFRVNFSPYKLGTISNRSSKNYNNNNSSSLKMADEVAESVKLQLRNDGQVAVVAFNRPTRGNSLNPAMGLRVTELIKK